jgi:hypothetical protein
MARAGKAIEDFQDSSARIIIVLDNASFHKEKIF